MELFWYIFLVGVAITFIVKRDPFSSKKFFIFYFFIALLTSYIARASGYDWDINNYAKSMYSSTVSLYYLKEPVVWFGLRFLYNFIQNELLVFVVMDMVAFLILYISLKSFKVPQYMYIVLFCFFPLFLGFQNIYRQFYSEVLFLYALSVFNKPGLYRWFIILLSVGAHNVSAFFSPLLILRMRYFSKPVFVYAWVFVVLVLLYIQKDFNSANSVSGLDLRFFYLLLIVLFFSLTHALIAVGEDMSRCFFVILLLNVGAIFFLSSTQSERIGMFSLVIMVILFSNLVEYFRPRLISRMLYVTFLASPIFLFSSTRSFLYSGL